MKFNKRCLTAFSDENPFMAMGTKSKLFDTSFSLTSELFLYDYSTGVQYPSLQTDNKFYRLKWCENGEKGILATGNEEGKVTLYTPTPEKDTSFEMLSSCNVLEGDVLGLDFNPSKNVLAAGSSNGKIIFWNLNKIDSQYTSDIPLTSNITCLSWNKKVSRILCAGTDDGKILILDIRAKNVAMTLGEGDITVVTDVMWHPSGSTSILATTNQKKLQCFNLSSDSTLKIGSHSSGLIGLSMVDGNHIAASSKEQIDIIEMKENKVVESIPVDGVFEVSFSKKDPLMALSYTGGITEVLPRITTRILSSNPGCVVEDKIVGSSVYKIEEEKMDEIEEDALMKKIKDLLYENGSYRLKRKELGELLLNEEINKNNNGMQKDADDLSREVSGLSMSLKFNLEDPLILTLIRGDLDEAYEKSIASDKTVPLSLFLALAKGRDCLPMDSDNVLILLSTAQLTSTFSHILEKISKDQWMAVIALISFSSLNDSEFILSALQMAEKLNDRDRLVVYAIANKLDEYFKLKTSTYEMPTSVYGVRDFFQSYKNVIVDLESMDGCYKSPVVSEYFWYAIAHGDKPTKIKYDDLGININLGRASESVKFGQKSSVSMNKGIQERTDVFGRRSPSLETQSPPRLSGEEFGNSSSAKAGFHNKAGTAAIHGYRNVGSVTHEANKTQNVSNPSIGGVKTPSNFSMPGERSSPGIPYVKPSVPKTESGSMAYKGIPQPPIPQSPMGSSYSAFSQNTGSFAPAPQHSPSSNTYSPMPQGFSPKPSYGTIPQSSTPSPSTYASMPQGTPPRTYASIPSTPSYPNSSMTSSYGAMSQNTIPSPSTYGSKPQDAVPSKPYIPKPGLAATTHSGAGSYESASPKSIGTPIPRPPGTNNPPPVVPSQNMHSPKTLGQATNIQEQPTSNLNAEEILNTFEAIIQDLTDRASSKANLIIRNKLKEVTKRLSIYNSVSRDTFSTIILEGLDGINKEIKNDSNSEEMKHNVRRMIVKCTETGENRADLWMPSIYTLLQIVYH